MIGLEGALGVNVQVRALPVTKDRKVCVEVVKVKAGNLLVQDLGQKMDAQIEGARLLKLWELSAELLVVGVEKGDLSKHLVSERTAHDETGVTRGAAKVDQTALCKQDYVVAVGKGVAVHTGLDLVVLLGIVLKPSDVDLDVEVANVADNGVVGHGLEVTSNNNITVTSGCNEDLTLRSSLLHGNNLVATDCRLEGIDRIDLGDKDASTHAGESHGTALTDIAETGNNGGLTSNHDVCGTLDSVNERLAAAVEVVELGLSHAVVDVDGRDLELALGHHFVEMVNTGGGLLGEAEAVLEQFWVLLMNKGGEVTTVVKDEIELTSILESVELLLNAPEILLLGLALPSKDRNASSSNSSSGMVLRGVDVARGPGNLGTETDKGLDENRGLNSHVETASNASTLERLGGSVLLAGLHETRHLVLGKFNLLAAESGERKVSDFEIVGRCRHSDYTVLSPVEVGLWDSEIIQTPLCSRVEIL